MPDQLEHRLEQFAQSHASSASVQRGREGFLVAVGERAASRSRNRMILGGVMGLVAAACVGVFVLPSVFSPAPHAGTQHAAPVLASRVPPATSIAAMQRAWDIDGPDAMPASLGTGPQRGADDVPLSVASLASRREAERVLGGW